VQAALTDIGLIVQPSPSVGNIGRQGGGFGGGGFFRPQETGE
jgi:hypothetical protein